MSVGGSVTGGCVSIGGTRLPVGVGSGVGSGLGSGDGELEGDGSTDWLGSEVAVLVGSADSGAVADGCAVTWL